MATPPLTAAVRRGRDRAERSLADHRRRLRTLGDRPDFDARRHLAVQQQLTAAIDARRRLTVALPDISLHDDALATEAPPLPAENAEIDGLEAGRVAETAGRGAGLGLPDRALRGQTA